MVFPRNSARGIHEKGINRRSQYSWTENAVHPTVSAGRIRYWADQLDLQFCALECVEVDLAGTLASLQGLVRSVDFVKESVRSEMSPVRSEIVRRAPIIFDLLGSS